MVKWPLKFFLSSDFSRPVINVKYLFFTIFSLQFRYPAYFFTDCIEIFISNSISIGHTFDKWATRYRISKVLGSYHWVITDNSFLLLKLMPIIPSITAMS